MQTSTLFTLRDKTSHNSLKEAMNHCDEMMGAEMRSITDQLNPMQNFLHRTMLDIVAHKKYDTALFEYVEWRKERDALEQFEEEGDYSH